MEKIDISKIRGKWQETEKEVTQYGPNSFGRLITGQGDDTIESIKMVAEKVNEIVEKINKLEKFTGNNLTP